MCVSASPETREGEAPEESPSGPDGGTDLPHLDEPSAADNSELDFVKRLYDFGLGKRAYSYVSEYKRLPVYNFGLGKRSKMYGFGLGKRAEADGRLYSFGLGKRDYEDYAQEDESGDDDEEIDDPDMDFMDKRDRLYSFGLGKRAKPYSFGIGKRSPSSKILKLYGFGLGKKGGSMYGFGLGKRADGRMFSFGLGKRPVNSGRQSRSRFNFGLGKRSDDIDSNEFEDGPEDEAKRSSQGQRFAFGLGKRAVLPSELEAVRNEERQKETSRKNMTAEDHDLSGTREKRSAHYGFGLGKRAQDSEPSSLYGDEADDESDEDFSRLARRPYDFGIGKRIRMYGFGIGKRSEH
jgi:hypothetical protein